MLSGRSLLFVVAVCAGCTGGSTDPADDYRPCLPNGGEFPPSACAQVVGRLLVQPPNRPGDFVVAVDTADRAVGNWFVAPPRRVETDGAFALLVSQIEPLGSPRETARKVRIYEVQVYRSVEDARNRNHLVWAQLVPMAFTPWGVLVEPTTTTIRIDSAPTSTRLSAILAKRPATDTQR